MTLPLCFLHVCQVRRGVDKADIFSISFSSSAQWLAVSSDRGTIHVFSLRGEMEEGEDKSLKRQDSSAGSGNSSSSKSLASPITSLNRGSSLSFMKGITFFPFVIALLMFRWKT